MKAAVKNVEEAIKGARQQLSTANIDTPMNNNYTPELDITHELDEMTLGFFRN